MSKGFQLTEAHITLLTSMRTDWNAIEYGAPNINPKRGRYHKRLAHRVMWRQWSRLGRKILS